MRSDREFWDDVVLVAIGTTGEGRIVKPTELADALLVERQKRHVRWTGEADQAFAKAVAEAPRPIEGEISLVRGGRPVDAIRSYLKRETGVSVDVAKRVLLEAAEK